MKYTILMVWVLFLGLSACTKNKDESVEPLFKTQTDALKKAQQVEQLIRQHDIDRRKQIDQQGR